MGHVLGHALRIHLRLDRGGASSPRRRPLEWMLQLMERALACLTRHGKPTLGELLEVQEHFGLPSPTLVEKD